MGRGRLVLTIELLAKDLDETNMASVPVVAPEENRIVWSGVFDAHEAILPVEEFDDLKLGDRGDTVDIMALARSAHGSDGKAADYAELDARTPQSPVQGNGGVTQALVIHSVDSFFDELGFIRVIDGDEKLCDARWCV